MHPDGVFSFQVIRQNNRKIMTITIEYDVK